MTTRTLLSTAMKFVGFSYMATAVISLTNIAMNLGVFNHQLTHKNMVLSILIKSIICAGIGLLIIIFSNKFSEN